MAQTKAGKTLDPLCFSFLLYRLCLLGCALGSTATLYQISGLLGHLNDPVPNLLLVAVLLGATIYSLAVFLSVKETSLVGRLSWYLVLAILITDLVLGLVPPTTRDELTHHLAISRLYADQGRIFEIPFVLPSYYPMLLEMFYVPFVRWDWDFVPKLVHGLFGLLTGLLVYSYLSLRLNRIYGLLGLLFFVSIPVILRLSSQAYVDLGLVFFSTGSFLGILQWQENQSQRWLVVAGLMAGFVLGTKPNGILVFFLLSLLLLFQLGGEGATRAMRAKALLFFASAFVAFSPWLLRNLFWTGNPVFPFFLNIFGGGDKVTGDPGLGILTRRRLLYGESWWEIAAVPLRIFFSGRDDQPQYFDGVLNPMLLVFLPWAFKGKWYEEKRLLFFFALSYLLFAVFLTDLRIRYLVPILPPLVILLVYAVHNIYLRIARPWILVTAVASLLALNLIYLASYFQRVSPLAYILGEESREAYLTRTIGEYPVFQYINQNLPVSARIYLLFVGRRAYYCRRSYFYDGGELPWVLLQTINTAEDPRGIEKQLKERNLTHLMAREELLQRFLIHNLPAQKLGLWQAFKERMLKELYHARGYSLYQING
jgi:Dolichyl-phosphate-mannose-protein mannosyltransferase